jgi:hypothetical protein
LHVVNKKKVRQLAAAMAVIAEEIIDANVTSAGIEIKPSGDFVIKFIVDELCLWISSEISSSRIIPKTLSGFLIFFLALNKFSKVVTGLQINLYLEQPMEIQLFATFFQRRK